MGKNQARILKNHPDFDLVAVCDIVQEAVDAATAELEVKGYTDLDAMMEAEQPAVVAIPTTSAAHAPLTKKVAPYDCVKGIYCEKPMATNMKDARDMNQVCKDNGVILVINHQRRIGADLVKAKELIDSGAIGEVKVVRGHCAGDFLSDGTHLVDSLMFLAGDPEVEWVVGTLMRDLQAIKEKWDRMDRPEPAEGYGFRFGHPVESGSMAVAQLANGVRAEFFTGDLQQSGRIYQDYVVEGTRGQIWRLRDRTKPHVLYIADGEGGSWIQDEKLNAIESSDGKGPWRPVELGEDDGANAIHDGYSFLAKSLRDGSPHPMNGDIAVNNFQVAMGMYESARTGKRIHAPVQTDRYPLEVMIEEGRAQ